VSKKVDALPDEVDTVSATLIIKLLEFTCELTEQPMSQLKVIGRDNPLL
jgi:hypothetical protein